MVIKAKKKCFANYLNNEIQLIKRYDAWNGYPWNVVNGIIKHILRNNDDNNTYNYDKDTVRIYNKIRYSGETADRLIKHCMKKKMKRELTL